jgi:hypothetical protein
MRSLIALVLLPLAAFSQQGAGSARIHSSSDRVSFGESCVLTWNSLSDEAYIFGVGSVSGSGSIQVNPKESSDYVLITDARGHIEYATAHVEVSGIRGAMQFPDPDDFRDGFRGKIRMEYLDFLNKVTSTLQNQLTFRVRGSHLPSDPNFLVYTNWMVQPELSFPDDKGIRRREVSYAVFVNEPQNRIVSFDIRALVQYQRNGESMWRPEQDQAIIQSAEKRLASDLEK